MVVDTPISLTIINIILMSKTFEELVQLRQDNKITWLEFVQQSDYADDYKRWLEERGTEPDNDSAELFLDMTDATFFDSQDK